MVKEESRSGLLKSPSLDSGHFLRCYCGILFVIVPARKKTGMTARCWPEKLKLSAGEFMCMS